MFKRFIFFMFIGISNSFVLNNNIIPNKIIYNNQEITHCTRSNVLLIDNKYTLIDKLLDITVESKNIGKIIVEQISGLLPKVDSVGHNVLHANNKFIDYILNETTYSEVMKKNIVLASIKLAIMGDQFGSHILQLYYDIVDKCL